MPYTLSEHNKNVRDDMIQGITKSWLDHYPYLDLFELKTIPGRTISWRREETLGTVDKRAINETFTEAYGSTSVQMTTLEILGGYLDIDRELLDEPTYSDEVAMQIDMKTRAMGFQAARDIVSADPGANINEFAGLKALTATLASRQVIDAASLDLSSPAAREANADEAVRLMMLGIQRIRSGTGRYPAFILLNDTLEQYIVDALRRSGAMKLTDDTFARRLAVGEPWNFAGVPVYDAGFLADQTTKVISDSHDSSNNTSMYFVYSSQETTRLVQKYGVRTIPVGLLDNGIHKRWIVEWTYGLQMRDKFSVARVKNWKVA